MDFTKYQDRAMETLLPDAARLAYMIPNLAAEAGEVCGAYAKARRDEWDYQTLKARIKDELGDVLWQIAGTCHILGLDLEDVAQGNLDKLASRQARGTLTGSGDHR